MKIVRTLMLAVVMSLALFLATTGLHASAAPTVSRIVSNTNDGGDGSLRQAILDLNGFGYGAIIFNIPGSGVHIISPTSNLPALASSIEVNGYSQPGASANTSTDFLNTVILIELDGHLIPSNGVGLELQTGNTVRGMAINRFSETALLVRGDSNEITGNFIGVDPNGTTSRPNKIGIELSSTSSHSRIGDGTIAKINLISGNTNQGLEVGGIKNTVHLNIIGLDRTVAAVLPNALGIAVSGNKNKILDNRISGNTYSGIIIDGNANKVLLNAVGQGLVTAFGNGGDGVALYGGAKKNRIGGLGTNDRNYIVSNGGRGISVSDAASIRNKLSANTLSGNVGLAIDLGSDGVTPNDPGDLDTGPNMLQNFPRLRSADVATQRIRGKIKTTPNTSVRIDLYFSTLCSGSGDAFFYNASQTVTTNGSGKANFGFTAGETFHVGDRFAVLATTRDGTSEMSPCKSAS